MTDLKDIVLSLVKNALKGRISESLLLETFEMDEELESVPIEQIKIAIAQLLNDCEIEETVKFAPTDSPTAFKQKTIYIMPDSFYCPEIKWEAWACLSFICPWEGVKKRFCAGMWKDDGFWAKTVQESKWVERPIHHMDRSGKWKVDRKPRRRAQMEGCDYFLVNKDGEVYELREVNDQY
jgi:hypothetical protein